MKDRDQKLYQIISDVLDVPMGNLSDDSNTDNIENWASLSHIHLVMAIEEGFGISISPEDTMDLLSVKIIRMYLEDRGIG